MAFVLQEKPSLGALLEHAIPLSSESDWKTAADLRIGFRKSHAFYQLQAQHRANFEKLEQSLKLFLHRPVRLTIESVAEGAHHPSIPVSIREQEKRSTGEMMKEKKEAFLAHEVVRHTKEIFGAELSSFDIDRKT